MTISIENQGNFNAIFRASVRLYKSRSKLVSDEKADVEELYKEHISSLVSAYRKYGTDIQEFCFSSDKNEREVAFHVLILVEKDFLTVFKNIIEDEESKKYWQICRVLSLIPLDETKRIIQLLLGTHIPYLINPISEVIGSRGITIFSDKLLEVLKLSMANFPNIYVIESLGYLGVRDAENTLLEILYNPNLRDEEYLLEKTATALLMIGSDEGLSYYKNAIALEDSSNLDIINIVANYGNERDAGFLIERLQNTTNQAWKIKLLEGLGYLGSIRSIPVLMESLSNENAGIREAANYSLVILTGETPLIDPLEEPEQTVKAWKSIWKNNKQLYDNNTRYRNGKPFSLRILIDKLKDGDSAVQRYAHHSLIIYSGQYFPLDTSAYISEQKEEILVWEKWFDETYECQDGTWVFAGKVLS